MMWKIIKDNIIKNKIINNDNKETKKIEKLFNIKCEQGSSSLEAALVMPIVFIIVLCIVYMSLYLHDYVIMKAQCTKGCTLIVEGSAEEKKIIGDIKSSVNKKTLIIKNITISIDDDGVDMVTMELEGEVNISFNNILKLGGKKASTQCSIKKKIDKAMIIKKMIADDMLSKIEQGEE